MTNSRACYVCTKSLQNKRMDTKTCSSSCRSKLFRSNKTKSVLVRFRVPQLVFTNLVVKALSTKKSVDDYLSELVINNE